MKKTLILALALLFLAGCGGRELANVSLVRTLGIDGAGPVTVTAVAGEEEERSLFHCEGVGQVVLGESATARALWDEVVHRDSGYGATVWLAEQGSAYGLLSEADDPAGRLKHLEESGVAAPSLLEAVSALTRDGKVTVPVVGLRGGEIQVTGERELYVDKWS